MQYDVIVAGAGPGGAYAAYIAAKKGLKTLLLEKEKMPRPKPCGGAVSQKAFEFLDFTIEPVVVNKIYGTTFVWNYEDEFTVSLEQPFCYLVRREEFDFYLMQRAVEAGAVFLDGCAVTAKEESPRDVRVLTGQGEFRGNYLIAADGVNGKVGRLFEIPHKIGITLEAEFPRDNWKGNEKSRDSEDRLIYVDSGIMKQGYAWVFPRGELLAVGVGTFAPKARDLRDKFNGFARRQGVDIKDTHGYPVPLFTKGNQKYHQGRSLVVGDAAGLVDPLSGEGIYFALKSGAMASETIALVKEGKEKNLSIYTERVKKEIAPSLSKAAWLAKLFYGFPRQAHKILKHNPQLAQEFLKLIYGNGKYKEVYKTLFRSIFGKAYK